MYARLKEREKRGGGGGTKPAGVTREFRHLSRCMWHLKTWGSLCAARRRHEYVTVW